MHGIKKTEPKNRRRSLSSSKFKKFKEHLNRERILLKARYRNAKRRLLDNSNLELAYLGKIDNLKKNFKYNHIDYSTEALRKGGKISLGILLDKRLDILSTRNSNIIRNAVLDVDPQTYADNVLREAERYGNTKIYEFSKATERKINEKLTPRREAAMKRIGSRLDRSAQKYSDGLKVVLGPHARKRKRYPEIEDL